MALYVIAYELNAAEPDGRSRHLDISKRIMSLFSIRLHEFEALWLVESDLTATEIGGTVADLLDGRDGLIVAALSGDAAWTPSFRHVARDRLPCAVGRAAIAAASP